MGSSNGVGLVELTGNGEPTVDNNGDVRKTLTATDGKPLPHWVENLMEHFEIVDTEYRQAKDKERKRLRPFYTLRCLLCKTKPGTTNLNKRKKKSKDGTNCLTRTDVCVTGGDVATFARHMESFHKEITLNRSQSVKRQHSEDEDESVAEFVVGCPAKVCPSVKKYDLNGTKQKLFTKLLLDCVALDGLPFSFVEGSGFRNLIMHADPKYTCPSRFAISRLLSKKNVKIREHLTRKIKDLKPECAHLILDIWSSRQRYSVLGIQVRFIKEWKIHQQVISFKHFPGNHDARSIKSNVEDILQENFGLKIRDFLTVTADNASAILLAFKSNSDLDPKSLQEFSQLSNVRYVDLDEPPYNDLEDEDHDWEDVEFEDVGANFDGENCVELEEEITANEEIESAIDSVIHQWTTGAQNSTAGGIVQIRRNSCLAHLLQLAIKDSLKNKCVFGIVKKVNSIVSWFHKSTKYYTRLRKLTKIGLVQPNATRWNSTYYCLKRLLRNIFIKSDDKREKKSVAAFVNEVIQEARKSKSKGSPCPATLTVDDISVIDVVSRLLEPLADLTDSWQGNGVTSSRVIFGLVVALRDLSQVDIDESVEHATELDEFKKQLMASVVDRFSTELESRNTVTGVTDKRRRIVTANVVNDKFYMLATLLDPRIKTTPFEDGFAVIGDVSFKNGYPTKSDAINLLKEAYAEEKMKIESDVIEVISVRDGSDGSGSCSVPSQSSIISKEHSSDGNSDGGEPKKRRSLLERLADYQTVMASQNKTADEIEQYLDIIHNISHRGNPLNFWKLNQERYPVLSSLAHKILPIPATSASVERLFSVAGAIISSRRAKMKLDTAEKLILYKEYLREGLSAD